MRTWLICLWILMAGCQSADTGPDPLGVALGKRFANLERHLDPANLEREARRVQNLPRHLDGDELARIHAAASGTRALVETEAGQPARIPVTAEAQLAEEERRTGRLPGDLRAAGVDPDQAARRLRKGVDEVPSVLGLDRQPMPEPSDPQRDTDPLHPPRRATWYERLLHRLLP